jgi:chemotaxis receptor (MCP) glutamine deamidase CheD
MMNFDSHYADAKTDAEAEAYTRIRGGGCVACSIIDQDKEIEMMNLLELPERTRRISRQMLAGQDRGRCHDAACRGARWAAWIGMKTRYRGELNG